MKLCSYSEYIMNKITTNPFIASAGVFGVVALVASLLYSLIFGASLFSSDDPYIIGLIPGCVTAFASLVYLLLKELNLKYFKPTQSIIIYYSLLATYCLFIEYIGGEASGFGYFFLTSIILSLPAFILLIRYPASSRTINYGIICGLIYLLGYFYILSIRI